MYGHGTSTSWNWIKMKIYTWIRTFKPIVNKTTLKKESQEQNYYLYITIAYMTLIDMKICL
jgi:hypothetical protein